MVAQWGELVAGLGEHVGRAKLAQVHRFVHGVRERVRALGPAPTTRAGVEVGVAEPELRELTAAVAAVPAGGGWGRCRRAAPRH